MDGEYPNDSEDGRSSKLACRAIKAPCLLTGGCLLVCFISLLPQYSRIHIENITESIILYLAYHRSSHARDTCRHFHTNSRYPLSHPSLARRGGYSLHWEIRTTLDESSRRWGSGHGIACAGFFCSGAGLPRHLCSTCSPMTQANIFS